MGKDEIADSFIKAKLREIKNCILDLKSAYYLKKLKKKPSHNGKIKVGFIVQMPELWDKQSSIYSKMVEDDSFDVYMIIVPAYDFANSTVGDYSDEKPFFISSCLNGQYLLAQNGSSTIDIRAEKFDYLFYQRPYDQYLPANLQSKNVGNFSRICYVPYATPDTEKTGIYPRPFFRNIYFGFMEDEHAAETNNEKNRFAKRKSFYSLGYTAFENCLKLKKECNYTRILWTPRWSYDPVIGGSHFVEYYEQLFSSDYGNNSLIVRPHPLMWSNFVKEGIFSQSDIENIKLLMEKNGIIQDSNANINDTFNESDIMISDRSSVIPMFFLTGKPIIYCPLDTGYSSIFKAIFPGLYIAEDWSELQKYMNMLLNHEDPLLDVRKKIIEESFLYNDKATNNIVAMIKNDFIK